MLEEGGHTHSMSGNHSNPSLASFRPNKSMSVITRSSLLKLHSINPEQSSQGLWRPPVAITTLGMIPGTVVTSYKGRLNVHLIKENLSLRETGGIEAFLNEFIQEALALARAHVVSLGGNALVRFSLAHRETGGNNKVKNAVYQVISLSGDMAFVEPLLV